MFSKFNHWITKYFLIYLKLRNLKFHLKHFLTSASQHCSRYIRNPWRKRKKKYKPLQSSIIYRSCLPVVWFWERRERAVPRVLVAVIITQGQGRATCGSAEICASARWGQLSFTAPSVCAEGSGGYLAGCADCMGLENCKRHIVWKSEQETYWEGWLRSLYLSAYSLLSFCAEQR